MEVRKVTCPKCNSEQVESFKKGFSGKKAVAGALLTGGIGVLVGTHGSNKLQVGCLNCGHTWDPAVLHKNERQTKLLDGQKKKKLRNRQFVELYEKGDILGAQKMIRPNYPNEGTILPITHERYKSIKASNRISVVLSLLFIGILVICLVKCMGH